MNSSSCAHAVSGPRSVKAETSLSSKTHQLRAELLGEPGHVLALASHAETLVLDVA